MKCEYCDSVIKEMPDNGICPNCGSALKTEPPKPPFSLIQVQGGFIELTSQGIRLCVKHPRKRRKDIMIPYEEIFDVSYVPANWWHNGFLCVREKKKQHIPLPRKFGQHWLGDTIAFFDEQKNSNFYQVYVFLKEFCLDCGSAQKTAQSKPPFSIVEGRGGFIGFNEQSIRFCVRPPRRPQIDIIIPYGEIYDVSYVPAKGWFCGFLCIREKKKQHIPLPRRFGEQRLGDTFIYFEKWDNDRFFQAYDYLKKYVGKV